MKYSTVQRLHIALNIATAEFGTTPKGDQSYVRKASLRTNMITTH